MGLYNETLQIHILMEVDRFAIELVSSGSDNTHKLEQTNALAYYEVRNVFYSSDPWPADCSCCSQNTIEYSIDI